MNEPKVYFLAATGRIKIGFTTDLKQRISDIGTHIIEPLVLIDAIDGDLDLEAAFHARLAKYRLKGEWFADCQEVRAVIEARNPACPDDAPKPPLVDIPALPGSIYGERVAALLTRAKRRWPVKPAPRVAAATGSPDRTAYGWLSGSSQMPGEAALALLDALNELDRLDADQSEVA